MSKQVGVARANVASDKSNNVNTLIQHNTDWKGISILVLAASVAYLVFFAFALAIAAIRCATSVYLTCNDTSIVFYIGLAIPLLVLIGVLTPTLIQTVKNMSFRLSSGVLMHRDDLRATSPQWVQVADSYAKSAATMGADYFAPTDSHNGGDTTMNKTGSEDLSDEQVLAGLIDLGDISAALDTMNKRG